MTRYPRVMGASAARRGGLAYGILAACVALASCGGSGAVSAKGGPEGPAADDERPPVEDDRSLCAWRGRTDREVIESKSPGARFRNVRRVFAVLQHGEERRRVLVCRETDTNLDGIKDVARQFDERGHVEREQADTDYDGKVDTWITFAGGRIVRIEIDKGGDGVPDEVRLYLRGVISRIQRDTNGDGRPDVWEVYQQGRLVRIGSDLDGDGHVDRWDRDEVARREQEQREREEEARGGAPEPPATTAPAGR
jgi:hypothetical protein